MREWHNDSDSYEQTSRLRQTNWNGGWLLSSNGSAFTIPKPCFWNKNFAFIPSISDRLMLSKPHQVPVICILFLDFRRFAIIIVSILFFVQNWLCWFTDKCKHPDIKTPHVMCEGSSPSCACLVWLLSLCCHRHYYPCHSNSTWSPWSKVNECLLCQIYMNLQLYLGFFCLWGKLCTPSQGPHVYKFRTNIATRNSPAKSNTM